MSFETEVKLYLAHLPSLHGQLEHAGAVLAKPRLFERNWRYENAAQTFSQNNIVLRLRQDDHARLTYKEPTEQKSSGSVTRVELETSVGDFDTTHAILEKLGFHLNMVYEKYRTTYHWLDTEIVLDEMPYGNFMEIEGAAKAIESVIHGLGLGENPRILASYVDLFEAVKSALGLGFRDLSFANFAGIAVPAALFENI